MIALVTDSSAQLPPRLAARLGVRVVPISVTIGDRSYREGVDLDADGFYRLVGDLATTVGTSQPAPGEFSAVYDDLARAGAVGVCSVHVGADLSGTVNSARLAAAGAIVPVRVVDTGTASFGVSLAVLAAAEAVVGGHGLDAVAAAADRTAAGVSTAFSLGAIEVARRSGRFAAGLVDTASVAVTSGVPVLGGRGADLALIGAGHDVEEVCTLLCRPLEAEPRRLRVGLALAHPATAPLVDALAERIGTLDHVAELIRYRVGPSIAAHTGVDTTGWVACPLDPGQRPPEIASTAQYRSSLNSA